VAVLHQSLFNPQLKGYGIMMTKEQALPYIGYIADDAGSFRKPDGLPCDTITDATVLVGWQCGFEPLFVAVKSYLGAAIDSDEAVELATDGLNEIGWFTDGPTEPDYIIL
jgi:hypothetical protein